MSSATPLDRILWSLTAMLALVAAGTGIAAPAMYEQVVAAEILPGVFTQDVMVVLAAPVLLAMAARSGKPGHRAPIVALGILGFLFYAYGIYSIEQIYTPLYLLYLAILSLSFFSIAAGLTRVASSRPTRLSLPSAVNLGVAAFGVMIAIVFNIVWIGRLLPLIEAADRIEYTFSVFVIDLVFIMPAFVICSVLAVRRAALGIVGLPALCIVGVGILSPLALAELLKPHRYGMPVDGAELALYGTLSVAFLVAATVYLVCLRDPYRRSGHARPGGR